MSALREIIGDNQPLCVRGYLLQALLHPEECQDPEFLQLIEDINRLADIYLHHYHAGAELPERIGGFERFFVVEDCMIMDVCCDEFKASSRNPSIDGPLMQTIERLSRAIIRIEDAKWDKGQVDIGATQADEGWELVDEIYS